MERKSRILFWAWTLVMLLLAVAPVVALPGEPTGADLVKHASAFFVFSMLLARSYRSANKELLMAAVAYGIFIELVQLFLPWRSASVWDVGADFVGSLAFVKLKPGTKVFHYSPKSAR